MADDPREPEEKDTAGGFPVSSRASSLLRRLQQDQEKRAARRSPPAPDRLEAEAPIEHVSPFTVEDVSAVNLETVEAQVTESTARDLGEALRRIEENMARVTREFADGAINQAQFQAIYTHYAEQKAVLQRMLARAPDSEAWRRAAIEGHTEFLRRQHAAKLVGLAVYDNWTSNLIHSSGAFDVPEEVMKSLLDNLSREVEPGTRERPQSTQIEGGRWLCYVRGIFTTGVSVYTAEPSTVQLIAQGKVHREFERVNRRPLEMGSFEPEYLVYPQDELFGGQ